MIVDCLTDNRIRTVADVRHAFGKFGGNLGTDGSVAFMFAKRGVIWFEAGSDEDRITEAAIEAGADDIVVYPEDGSIDVLTTPDTFAAVKAALERANISGEQVEQIFMGCVLPAGLGQAPARQAALGAGFAALGRSAIGPRTTASCATCSDA